MTAIANIRRGEAQDIALIADILAESMRKDPALTWSLPIVKLYPRYFRLLVEGIYLPNGFAHIDKENAAASLWLPPGAEFSIPINAELMYLALRALIARGPLQLWRTHQQSKLYQRQRPEEPHYYLQFIGCKESDRKKGRGSKLLNAGLYLCDQQHMPAYLECATPELEKFYAKHGFETIARQQLGLSGPTIYFMWREKTHPNSKR